MTLRDAEYHLHRLPGVQGGLKWADDATIPRDFSNNVAIENVRVEQIGRHPGVFAIDIQKDPNHPLHELSLRNCLTTGPGGGWNGVRATGVESLVYDRTVRYEGPSRRWLRRGLSIPARRAATSTACL